jgi:DNA-binding NarL/FixJ family response regulator
MKVLLADDHALFRDGIRSLLEARGAEVVGEAENGREAVELAKQLSPDVVLMDLNMPEMGGLAATRLISADAPEVKVVMLTASEDDADLFEAIKSGAQGYLLKNLKADELMAMLENVLHDEPALTPALARKLLGEFAKPAATRHERASDELTDREREVLELLVHGVTSNRELAERLIVTENTVKYHLRNILGKLHLQNRAQVVAYALNHRLISPANE